MKREADSWTDAARALAEEAEGLSFVAGLASSGLFQTRGRGKTVYGVMLRAQDGGAFVRIGLSLDEAAVRSQGAGALLLEARKRLIERWSALDTGLSLQLDVILFDILATAEVV